MGVCVELFEKTLFSETESLFLKLPLRKHKMLFSMLIAIDLANIAEIGDFTLLTKVIVVKIALIDYLKLKILKYIIDY